MGIALGPGFDLRERSYADNRAGPLGGNGVRKGTTMKTSLTLTTLTTLTFLLSSCMVVDLQWEQGNGVAATETRSLPAFERVDLECPVHVIIKTGPSYSAYVTSDANLTGYFQTDAFAGTLTIGMASGIQPSVEPEITIVMPELRGLTHNGNGLVEIREDGNFPTVDLTLNGSGKIFYSGTAATLSAAVNGSGAIEMEGYASLLRAEVRGNGELHGENLLTGDADVALSGSGLALLDLDYQSVLNLDLTGSGQVEWWGSPSQLNYHLAGEGKVVEHRGLPKKTAGAKTAADAGKLSRRQTEGGLSTAAAAAKAGAAPAYEMVAAGKR